MTEDDARDQEAANRKAGEVVRTGCLAVGEGCLYLPITLLVAGFFLGSFMVK